MLQWEVREMLIFVKNQNVFESIKILTFQVNEHSKNCIVRLSYSETATSIIIRK